MKANLNKDWKIMARETLLDIYSSSIANYLATGKRTNRPAIDHQFVTRPPRSRPNSRRKAAPGEHRPGRAAGAVRHIFKSQHR